MTTLETSCQWISAAGALGIGFRLARPSIGHEVWSAHYALLILGREQFACEKSFERYVEAIRSHEKTKTLCDNAISSIDNTMMRYLEMHSFLVSAHTYWRALKIVNRIVNSPILSNSVSESQEYINITKSARDHMEHIDERIQKGRMERFGNPMSSADFRRTMGQCDATGVTFGTEHFDLARIHAAICKVGRTVPKVIENEVWGRISITKKLPSS